MATAILRPNSAVAHTWSEGINPDNVDDEVTQPDAGDALLIRATGDAGDNNEVEIFGFPTISGISEVTNITVWTNGSIMSAGTPEVDVDMGGLQGYVECNLPGIPGGWTSNSFDGSWNQSDLDGLEVRYRADCPDVGKGAETNSLDVVYVVVTYTLTGGYGHKVYGIAPANIAKVNGVPTANIAKVNGV